MFVREFIKVDSSQPISALALVQNTGLTNTPGSGNFTTASDNNLLLGFLFQTYQSVTYTAPSGFTIDLGTSGDFSTEHGTAGGAGTYSVTFDTSDVIATAIAGIALQGG